jgi:putative peptidoglycan binding protein
VVSPAVILSRFRIPPAVLGYSADAGALAGQYKSVSEKTVKTAALAMLAFFCVPSSYAEDTNHAFGVRGAGILTCETFLQEMAKKSNAFYLIGGWLDGYVTGVNQYAPDTYDALSFETTELVASLLENHCKAHATDPLFAVVNALLTQLHDDRIRAKSPGVNGKVGEQAFTLYAEVLQRVQRKLTDLGYYQGDMEAEFGDKTREALAGFQGKNNLKPTGLPDPVTLWQLLRRPDSSKRGAGQ